MHLQYFLVCVKCSINIWLVEMGILHAISFSRTCQTHSSWKSNLCIISEAKWNSSTDTSLVALDMYNTQTWKGVRTHSYMILAWGTQSWTWPQRLIDWKKQREIRQHRYGERWGVDHAPQFWIQLPRIFTILLLKYISFMYYKNYMLLSIIISSYINYV